MTQFLCIYHGKCADGFTSAWAVNRAGFAPTDIEFFPGVYGEAPPDVTGRDVILVDFSYKRPVLTEMAMKANTVLILDHHKTAAEDLAGFEPLDNVKTWDVWRTNGGSGIRAVFDMNRSGAGITWDFFHPGTERPRLVSYVEDRDLWHFAWPGSRDANANIFSYEYTFENWDMIAKRMQSIDDFYDFAQEGAAIERKHHKDVAELVEVCRRRMVIGGQEVWGASIPYTLTSDAGNLMSEGEPFAACYWDTPKGRVFSLRSKPEGSDVSAIAASYGGGGHKNASGFTVLLSDCSKFELSQ